MRRLLLALVVGSFASLVACTVENTPASGGGSSSSSPSPSGSSTSAAPPNVSAEAGSPSSSGGPNGAPPASQTEATVDVDGTCSAFQACGGNPQGTYDYTGGCIEDVFAGARGACPALDTSKAIVKVKGSITFAGNALTRNVTVTTTGSLLLPESCTYGQCAAIESELKSAFDSVSCTGSADCTCTISKTETEADATTYTIQGSVVTTADGDQYSICEKGVDLTYSGHSAGSEEGTFSLKKR
jgi:hypothetical protein